MKSRVVWRFYLYWFFHGLEPIFGGFSYFYMMDVYKLDSVQYGSLITLSSITMLAGVLIYNQFLKEYEMRTLLYWVNGLGVVLGLVDLWQVKRYNLEYGISDYKLICFGTILFEPINFAMTQIPAIVTC